MTNLIVNPGAEIGAGNGGIPTGWTRMPSGCTACMWASNDEDLDNDTYLLSADGSYVFYGGAGGTNPCKLYQDIDVSSIADEIDALGVTYSISGRFGGHGEDDDTCGMDVSFLNSVGGSITSYTIGNPDAGARSSTTCLIADSYGPADVPASTRTIRVTLEFTSYSSGNLTGYADSLSLELSMPLPGGSEEDEQGTVTDGYEQYLPSPVLGPPWMHGPWANKIWAAVGRSMDQQDALIALARKAAFPDEAVSAGMSDALDKRGDDLMLPRGGTAPYLADETDVAYAARLKASFETWGQDETTGGGAGSVLAILQQLKIAGFPVEPTDPYFWTTGAMLVNHNGYLYQLIDDELHRIGTAGICINRQNLAGAVTGLTGFTLDARDQFYSRFAILFLEDVPTLTNADCPAKSRLNAICNRWKSGSAIYSGAAVIPQEDSAKVIGWPIDLEIGAVGLQFGANGARFIDPD